MKYEVKHTGMFDGVRSKSGQIRKSVINDIIVTRTLQSEGVKAKSSNMRINRSPLHS